MTYQLLEDQLIMQETAWQISIHLEHFNCKNNKIPCQNCRVIGAKLAPLFLFAIDTIAEKVTHHPRSLAQVILDKIGKQKWQTLRPWRTFSIPTLKPEMIEVTTQAETPAVTYKLVKRHKDAV